MSAKVDQRLQKLGLPMGGRRVLVPDEALGYLLAYYETSLPRMVEELSEHARETIREALPLLDQFATLMRDDGRTADQIRADALAGVRRVESIAPSSDFL
jgi:hypothetical protein